MPESVSAIDANVPVSGQPAGHGFSFEASIAHHNHPYPAWQYGKNDPIIIFNLPVWAGKKLDYFQQDATAWAAADGSKHLAWAEASAAKVGAKLHQPVAAGDLAKAMAIAESRSGLTFPQPLSFFHTQTFFGTVALIVVSTLVLALGRRRPGQVRPEGRGQHFLESIVCFVRDDIVRPNIHHGEKWAAHFSAIFLAVAAFNLMGLVPGTGTASGNIMVTAGFAVTTLLTMLIFGMKEQGIFAFWRNLVPYSLSRNPLDWVIFAILVVIEVMGLIIKPTALAIRLFANMFAGHTVLLAFLSLFYIIHSAGSHWGLSLGLGAFGLAVGIGIYFLELLVALLQAYVFTLLSAVFVGASVHPEH